MYIRPKTMRRLVVLGGTAAILAGLVVGGYFLHASRQRAALDQSRRAATAAHEAGDHATALEHFSTYLHRSKTAEKGSGADFDALLAYAKSRRAIPTPQGRHLIEAVNVLERCRQIRPADAEVRGMLLELYPRTDPVAGAALADEVLAEQPEDAAALRAKVECLAAQARHDRSLYTQALAASRRLNDVAPADLRAQLRTLWLMRQARAKPEEIIARAEGLRAKHPADPRFDVLLASAHHMAGNDQAAAAAVTKAAAVDPPDAQFTMELVRHLDAFGRFPESERLLERAAAKFKTDADLSRALAVRQWQQGRHEAVAQRLASLDPASRASDPSLLALRAMSLHALGKRDEAGRIVAALAERKADGVAEAWATALRAHFALPAGAPKDLATAYRAALKSDPNNAVIHFLLGQAYARMGEDELAVTSWRQAAAQAPTWPAPFAMIGRTLIEAGRFAEAAAVTTEAVRRSPGNVEVLADLVVAGFGALSATGGENSAKAEALLAETRKIQAAVPGEPRTLPVYVALLARTGRRDEAEQAVRSALDRSGNATAPATLLRLAVVSKDEGLGLEQELEARAAGGAPDPRAALRQAIRLHESARPDEGLKVLRSAAEMAEKRLPGNPREPSGSAAGPNRAESSKPASTQPANEDERVRWQVTILQYRDLIGDAGTSADWAALADARPQDLHVQAAVLASPARARDRAMWQRTIDRVRQLTGDEAHLWQLERARFVLSADRPAEHELNEVTAKLTDLARTAPAAAEPHRLLALAHEKSADGRGADERRAALTRAVESMTKAADLRPADAGIAGELVRLLRLTGRADRAAEYLDRLASRKGLGGEMRRFAADAYAELGEADKALKIISAEDGGATGDTDAAARHARLASLYRKSGRPDEADTHYRKLLDAAAGAAPTAAEALDAGRLVEAAEFFAGRGAAEQAERCLALLDKMELPAGRADLVRAKFYERHGPAEQAARHFQAATKAPGAGAEPWRELAGYHLRARRFDRAAATTAKALKEFPTDPDLAALKSLAGELSAFGGDPTTQVLIDSLSLHPRDKAAREMLRVLAEAKRTGEPAAQTTARLREAADRHPQFLPLQFRAARDLLASGQLEAAEQVARRTAGAFPNDPEALRLLCGVYTARRDWPRLKDAATAWRRLSADDPLPADVTLAEAALEAGDPSEAIERLRPHIDRASSQANDDATQRQDVLLVGVYARALIAAGRADDAAGTLEPRARQSPAWRGAWMKLATARHPGAAAAGKWLARVEPHVPESAPAERLDLAAAWFAVGQKYGDTPAYESARAIARSLTETTDPAAATNAWVLAAVSAQALGDYEQAVHGHRKVFESHPDAPEAQNNLAYALLLRGDPKDLTEAGRLARQAVSARPAAAGFRDTLARVEAAAGDPAAAAEQFRKALESDPGSVEARIGLADVLANTGKRSEARALLTGIEKELQLAPTAALQPPLRGQLERVRTALRNPAGPGTAR